jgi:hypothetical protein
LIVAIDTEQTFFALDSKMGTITASQFTFIGQKIKNWSLIESDLSLITNTFYPLTKSSPILLQAQNLKQIYFFVPSSTKPSIISITADSSGCYVDAIRIYFESDVIFFQSIMVLSSTELHRTILSYDPKTKRLHQHFSDLIDGVPILFDPFTIRAKNKLIRCFDPKLIVKHLNLIIEHKNFE